MDSSIAPNRDGQLRSANKTDDTTFDRIWKFYHEPNTSIELHESEEKIRERWEFAWQMMCGINTKRQIAKMMSRRYQISERTAWTDISNAKLLFGVDPQKSNKQAERELSVQWVMMGMKVALKLKKMDAYERLLGRYNKLLDLENHEDNGLGDIMKKIKPHIIEFNADPETLQKQADELMKDVEDIDFEDMSDER